MHGRANLRALASDMGHMSPHSTYYMRSGKVGLSNAAARDDTFDEHADAHLSMPLWGGVGWGGRPLKGDSPAGFGG